MYICIDLTIILERDRYLLLLAKIMGDFIVVLTLNLPNSWGLFGQTIEAKVDQVCDYISYKYFDRLFDIFFHERYNLIWIWNIKGRAMYVEEMIDLYFITAISLITRPLRVQIRYQQYLYRSNHFYPQQMQLRTSEEFVGKFESLRIRVFMKSYYKITIICQLSYLKTPREIIKRFSNKKKTIRSLCICRVTINELWEASQKVEYLLETWRAMNGNDLTVYEDIPTNLSQIVCVKRIRNYYNDLQ